MDSNGNEISRARDMEGEENASIKPWRLGKIMIIGKEHLKVL